MMQKFMIKKGLINSSMTEQEMREFLVSGRDKPSKERERTKEGNKRLQSVVVPKGKQHKLIKVRDTRSKDCEGAMPLLIGIVNNSASEVTIYKRAIEIDPKVPNVDTVQVPITSEQIDKFIADARANQQRKSTSSEEEMDTSDECDTLFMGSCLIAGGAKQPVNKPEVMTHEEQAAQVIREAELSKAKLLEVQGKNQSNVFQMDQDYQMLDFACR